MQLRIFLIDDDEIQNDIMEEYIELCEVNASAEFHCDSHEAIEVLESKSIDELPHVIVMDLTMPKLNGWEFMDRVSTLVAANDWNPSVFMASSSVLEGDLLKASAIPQLKQFLNKPVRLQDLKELLQNEENIHCKA